MKLDDSTLSNIYAKCVVVGTCLIWLGAKSKRGYGVVCITDGAITQKRKVHRVVWMLLRGPIPEGYEIDHVRSRGCESRACCDVAHLEPVTHAENMARSRPATKVACIRGHKLNGGNLVRSALRFNKRNCRECKNDGNRRRRRGVYVTGPRGSRS